MCKKYIMKNEITLGQALSALFTLIILLVGWGASVEVRFAEYKANMETILEMKDKINKTYETVIVLDYQQNGIRTRGVIDDKNKGL